VFKYITATSIFIKQAVPTDTAYFTFSAASNWMIHTKTLGKVSLRNDNCLHLPLSVLRNSGRNLNSSVAQHNAEKRLSLLLYAVKDALKFTDLFTKQ
jgi:hypothetical protein